MIREEFISMMNDAVNNLSAINVSMECKGKNFVNITIVPDSFEEHGEMISVFTGGDEICFDTTEIFMDEANMFLCGTDDNVTEVSFN